MNECRIKKRHTYQKTGCIVQKTAEANRKAALEQMTVLGRECIVQRQARAFGGQERVPH